MLRKHVDGAVANMVGYGERKIVARLSQRNGDDLRDYHLIIDFMVRPERFELPAFWFVARRSIQLSYGRT